MPVQYVTSIVEGQDFYVSDVSPSGVTSAARGSICLRVDDGNTLIYVNTTTGTAPAVGTVWVAALTTDLSDITQVTLLDNANPALDIGSTGLLNLLRFITTNGAEQVAYNGAAAFRINTGGLQVVAGSVSLPEASLNLSIATTDAADGTITAGFFIRKSLIANATGLPFNTDVVLPARVGGWRVVDAYIISAGATGGSVQVNTTAPAAVTNAMVPGNADVVTRNSSLTLANATFASGASIRLTIANGSPATEAFIRIEPL